MATGNKRHKGDLNAFHRQLKRLEEGGYSFRVEYNGSTRHIVYLDEKTNEEYSRHTYIGNRAGKRFVGAHIVKEVKTQLLARINNGERPPKFKTNTKVVSYSTRSIKECIKENKGNCVALDIKSCYWETAQQLGIISYELYDKYIDESSKWKQGMVSSIGALNKQTATLVYSDGKIATQYMDITFGKTRPYYWAVINRVQDLMLELIEELDDDYLMWLTDCVYVKKTAENKARDIIHANGYETKKMNAKMVKVENRAIWFQNDQKSKPTYISYSQSQDVNFPQYKC